jgi:hypothetical protein
MPEILHLRKPETPPCRDNPHQIRPLYLAPPRPQRYRDGPRIVLLVIPMALLLGWLIGVM